MKQAERGFTLVETMTALLVLGIFITFAVPLHRELNQMFYRERMEMEMVHMLEHKIESLASNATLAGAGSEQVSSQELERQNYQITWRSVQIGPYLYEVQVEVNGKDRDGKIHKKRWVTHRFVRAG
jgi:prepilin-type N-terminal cleavage/methylation domain-containing protein